MNENVKQAVTEYLVGLLKVLDEAAEVQHIRETERELFVNLQGVKTFDGKDSKTLRSLSYLVEIAVRRRLGVGIRVQLDVDRYRERRTRELQELAYRLAEEAVREGRSIPLEPMENYERKAIHEVLSDHPGVRTYSEGQGSERHVIIEPLQPKPSNATAAQTPNSARESKSQ